ncbi:MAG: glycosyltransferase family 2 protein [Candidatus Saccharimonas sp.]|nr:glycosyltransferase family 2 protein [Planctomycetaceae bacterium]
MTIPLQLLFWLSVFGLGYIFAGYPLVVWWQSRSGWSMRVKQSIERPVSIVIVAHNEARTLPKKVLSLLASTRSEWIREILIGSDGSTDDTALVLSTIADPRVKLFSFASRRGKPAVLNELVPQCQSEFVLLADARQEFAPDCIERLLENFTDPTVGVVSGELVLRATEGASTAAQGIGFYWKYEKFIRRCESLWRGVPGATGACYAIRKSLFRPIPEQTILDDVVIPMQAVTRGYRCVFEPAARVFDEPSQSSGQESVRKRRTIAGAAQLVRLFPEWLSPAHNPLWFEYVSHKLMRLLAPLLMVLALATNLMLLNSPAYWFLLNVQAVFYVSAAIGWLFQRQGRRSSLFGPSLMFVTLNLTTTLALWDAFRAKYRVTWQKTT